MRPCVHACLIYHGVLAPGDPEPFDPNVHVAVDTLAQHLELLLGLGAGPTTIDDIAAAIARGEALPPFSASITFDDAYANVVTNALPLLTRSGFAATMFAPAGLVGTNELQWNDQLHALVSSNAGLAQRAAAAAGCAPVETAHELVYVLKAVPASVREETIRRLEEWSGLSRYPAPGSARICTGAELRTLQSHGWHIGSHTLSHPMLPELPDAEAAEEIGRSREQLAAILGEPPCGFAYPDGAFTGAHMHMVKDAGYAFAVTTEGAPIDASQDVFSLSRVYPQPDPARLTCLVTGFEQRGRALLHI